MSYQYTVIHFYYFLVDFQYLIIILKLIFEAYPYKILFMIYFNIL